MKKLLLGLVATTALIATPALAADLPPARQPNYYKAPPLPPVFSWTGCYVGADIGGGFVRDADNEHTAAGGTSPFSPAPTNIANSSGVMAADSSGAIINSATAWSSAPKAMANWPVSAAGPRSFRTARRPA